MTETNLVDMVIKLPAIQRLLIPVTHGGHGYSKSDLGKALKAQVNSVVNEVAGAYEWDFALSVGEKDSVTDQANYELTGNNNDNAQIHSVMYGDDNEMLTFKTMSSIDEMLTRLDVSGCYYWTLIERQGKFPRIRIVDPPSADGDTITYRYWRNNVNVGEFPITCDYLLVTAMAKRFSPSYEMVYEKALSDAIESYNRSGIKTTEVKMGSSLLRKTNKRHTLHGYS